MDADPVGFAKHHDAEVDVPRSPREDYRGAWHHVFNRGARRAPIFRSDEHCGLFLTLVAEAVERYCVEVHAFSLMPNHYHLLLCSPATTLSEAMRHIGGELTRQVNRIHRWDGPMFRGRFRNEVIKDEEYLLTVFAYIHLNPVRARLVGQPDDYCWTSHRAYIGLDAPPDWLSTNTLLEYLGGEDALHDYVLAFRDGRSPWPQEIDLRTGLRRRAKRKRAERKRSQPRSGEAESAKLDDKSALALIVEITGSTIAELRRTTRGRDANPARRFASWALADGTLLSHQAIGERLSMTKKQVGNNVQRLRRGQMSEQIQLWRDAWDLHRKSGRVR